MSEKLKRGVIVSVLTCLVSLTLMPLALMFYGSLKPAGTLGKSPKELPLTALREDPSAIPGVKVYSLPLHMDMRKFKALEFYAKGDKRGEHFQMRLKDILGNETSVLTRTFLKKGVSQDWQKVSVPLSTFELQELNPWLPEKVAEELWVILEGKDHIAIRDMRLVFKRFTLANYRDILVSSFFGRYFFNSLLITLIVVSGNLLFASMVGYAFARRQFPGKEFLFLLVLGSIMIPPQVFMVPVFILMKNFHWLNT